MKKKHVVTTKYVLRTFSDLSKTLDCLLYDLVIVKFHTFGVDYQSLKTIYFDLSEGVQVARVGSSYGQILFINPLYVTDLSVTPGNTVFRRVYKKTRGTERVTT